MGSIGNNQSTIKREEIKGTPLIFGEAGIHKDFIDIDGYSNKKTLKGALEDLAKALAKYDKDEADYLRTAISANELERVLPVSGEGNAQYILDYEDVPSASRIGKDGEIEYKNGRWYLHTRVLRG